LICLAMSGEMIDQLQLPLMAQSNGSQFGTNFTVSIEAREGVTTGISAADRATTILAAVKDGVQPEDIVTPGHIFRSAPKTAEFWSVPDRPKVALTSPALQDDGTMARLPDLKEYAKQHDLKICSTEDLIKYRMKFGSHTVTREADAEL
ncbi:3,4-dihydroxy-2-butanone 4-phosphate synthase, RibB like protein, partial [Aduncisulcus paluster]